MHVLQQWRSTQLRECREWGLAYAKPIDDHGGLVFTREDGQPLDPEHAFRTFVTLVRRAGLLHLKLHGLRHLTISLQLEAGVSETIIAMRVGLTTLALIRSTYGHLISIIGQGNRRPGTTQDQGGSVGTGSVLTIFDRSWAGWRK